MEYLRFSPELVNGINVQRYGFDPISGQNISAVYEAGDVGTVSAKSKDRKGQEWYFDVMDSKPYTAPSIYYAGTNKYEAY